MFGSEDFKRQASKHPERFWLSLICLFEICRREEAGQLGITDIDEEAGVPFLKITDTGEGQGLLLTLQYGLTVNALLA